VAAAWPIARARDGNAPYCDSIARRPTRSPRPSSPIAAAA